MSTESIQPFGSPMRPSLSGERPSLPAPMAPGKGEAISTRFWAIPKEFFGDQQWMLFLCLFFGVTTQAFSLAGGNLSTYVPYLGLVSSPLYLYHAMSGTVKNFKMVGEAAKTKSVGESFFFLLLGISSFGTALGDILKPISHGVEIAGLTHRGFCALIYAKILPVVLVAGGAVSGASAAAEMTRMQVALNSVKERLEEADLEELEKILNGMYTRQVSVVDERNRQDRFLSSNLTRKLILERRFAKHSFAYSCPLKKIKLPDRQDSPLLHEVQQMMLEVIEGKGTFGRLKEVISSIEKKLDEDTDVFGGDEIKAFREALKQQKEEIEKLEKGYPVFEDSRAEMHRKIAAHAISLFLAVLTLTGGAILKMKIPHHEIVGRTIIVTGCMTSMGNILFDKCVSHDQYLKMDRWLYGRLKKISESETV